MGIKTLSPLLIGGLYLISYIFYKDEFRKEEN